MTGRADRTTRTGPDLADREIDTVLRGWSIETDGPLTRNRVMDRFGLGATRATRLLDRATPDWRARTTGPVTGPPVRPDEAWDALVTDYGTAPDRTEQEPTAADQDGDGPVRHDVAAAPDRTADHAPRIRGLLAGLYVIAASAGVAIWSGWVSLGEMCGYGPVRVLPGIVDHLVINAAIALPLGMEAYAAIALRVWIAGDHSDRTRGYARISTLMSLATGAGGQVAYHLLAASHHQVAPWPIVTGVSVLPVAVLGMAAGLTHLVVADVRARIH